MTTYTEWTTYHNENGNFYLPCFTRPLSVYLFLCKQLHVKTTGRIFAKIFPEMYVETRKRLSSFGSHRIGIWIEEFLREFSPLWPRSVLRDQLPWRSAISESSCSEINPHLTAIFPRLFRKRISVRVKLRKFANLHASRNCKNRYKQYKLQSLGALTLLTRVKSVHPSVLQSSHANVVSRNGRDIVKLFHRLLLGPTLQCSV